jgi:hypothetical protein
MDRCDGRIAARTGDVMGLRTPRGFGSATSHHAVHRYGLSLGTRTVHSTGDRNNSREPVGRNSTSRGEHRRKIAPSRSHLHGRCGRSFPARRTSAPDVCRCACPRYQVFDSIRTTNRALFHTSRAWPSASPLALEQLLVDDAGRSYDVAALDIG